MIDTRKDKLSGGIGRSGIASHRIKTIFRNELGAARQAKLKLLAKGVLNPVLRIPDRGLRVLNAVECVACYHGKSREPVISQRKNISCIEVIGHHALRADF